MLRASKTFSFENPALVHQVYVAVLGYQEDGASTFAVPCMVTHLTLRLAYVQILELLVAVTPEEKLHPRAIPTAKIALNNADNLTAQQAYCALLELFVTAAALPRVVTLGEVVEVLGQLNERINLAH